VKLDQKTVARLELADDRDDVIHFDNQLTGFGFRLRRIASGAVARSWIVQYRSGGATRRMRIGSDFLTAAEARRQAEKILAKVALGEDPQADRHERRAKDQMQMRAVVAEYLAAKQARPKTLMEITRYLTDPRYFGTLHRLPVDKISRQHIANALITISRERGTTTASIARAAISALFTWAMQMGLVESNPTIGCVRFQIGTRDRVLNNDELRRIWLACGDDDFGRIVKLLILTGARRAEVGGMCWPEINFAAGTWTIPAVRTKNARAHTLPLPQAAIDIIEDVTQIVSRDQLFGQRCASGFSAWNQARQAFDAAVDVGNWVLHDIRRSVATGMADLGIAPHVIETILNHVSGHKGGVAGIYNRSSYEREVKQALSMWSDHVRALVEGGERKVVVLHAK
jgi:integrase